MENQTDGLTGLAASPKRLRLHTDDGRIIAARVMLDEVGSASRGEEPMTKRKTEEESLVRRKPDAPQLPKVEIDLETLVAAGIAAAIIRSPKKRRNPRSNPAR